MKKYGWCIASFVIAVGLLFTGIFAVTANASDVIGAVINSVL